MDASQIEVVVHQQPEPKSLNDCNYFLQISGYEAELYHALVQSVYELLTEEGEDHGFIGKEPRLF